MAAPNVPIQAHGWMMTPPAVILSLTKWAPPTFRRFHLDGKAFGGFGG
jgi:hypothetical protein